MNSRELLDNDFDDYIAHELFHQWFGDLVTCESWSNLPLNESFATYSEYLWMEHKWGRDAADEVGFEALQSYLNESVEKQVDLIRFEYDNKEDMFDNHSYAKGSRVLHMLRSYVGSEAFFMSLSTYIKKHAYSSVEIDDLRQAFEDVTGEDLNWFFDQWFLASGHPKLEVQKEHEDNQLILKVWQRQDLTTTPLYRLPLLVDIFEKDTVQRYSIEIDQSYQEFRFSFDEKPNLVLIDAQQQLLGEIFFEKTPEELAFQYRGGELFETRYEAIYGLQDSIHMALNQEIMFEALSDTSTVLRQMAVNAFDGFSGDSEERVVERLLKIIDTDSKTTVRADAISVLASIGKGKYNSLYKRNAMDSSYAVAGAALYAYGQYSGDSSRVELLSRFENEDNINIVVPIADYYTINKVPEKLDWFSEKLKQATSSNQWYITQYIGQYMLPLSNTDQMKGVSLLEDLSRNSDTDYIRLVAFQTLGMFESVEALNIREIRKNIIAGEKNEKLAQAFREDL